MKFELEPYKRREPKNTKEAPDQELIADVIRVAKLLKKNAVTKQEYVQHGKYSAHALHNRFGGWFSVLERAKLRATRSPLNIPKDKLIHDLICVSRTLGKNSVTREEYGRHGKYSASTIASRLGSWFKALEAAGLEKTRVFGVTDEEYFKNIEEVWIKLGRQPRYAEIEKPLSKYSAGAYEHRFGTWRKALETFVSYVNKEQPSSKRGSADDGTSSNARAKVRLESQSAELGSAKSESAISRKTKRQVSDRLRFLVMRRDGFTCRLCGRSPSAHPGLDLVIDHIIAWTKGGETVYGNLQTLCRPCNGGKGDLGQSE